MIMLFIVLSRNKLYIPLEGTYEESDVTKSITGWSRARPGDRRCMALCGLD